LKSVATERSTLRSAALFLLLKETDVANTTLSRLLIGGLLLGAGAAQAAGPISISEVPASWYADRISTTEPLRGATQSVFPSGAYEHGPIIQRNADVQRSRTRPSVAGSTVPFPASPNESGSIL
jgi:hypothetical protein